MHRILRTLPVLLLSGWVLPLAAGEPRPSSLAAAREYVEASDRYLHHSHLKRGMKGYGLSVFAGTKIERFDVEIVSVITNMGPQQDAILARCTGQNLEQTGIIAGMSGSPVFVTDPRDGKDKMIGAVAFGWSLQKEPLGGIQPITQMIATTGFLPRDPKDKLPVASAPADAAPRGPGQADSPPSAPRPAMGPSLPREFLDVALDPRKRNFAEWALERRQARQAAASHRTAGLVPLATPLMVSGLSTPSLQHLADALVPLGLQPLAGGGASGAVQADAAGVRLEPGSAVCIPMVTGDADWSGVGTVTDVVDGRVLVFGHSMFSEGDLKMPMGTGVIHTVVSKLDTSFKLGATLQITGATERDEYAAVLGRLGEKAPTIPMRVTVEWKDLGRTQQFEYHIIRHPWITPLLAYFMVAESTRGQHELPPEHTVRHAVSVDYGPLGIYRAENSASGADLGAAVSDVTRPIALLCENPLTPPIYPQAIDVRVIVEARDHSAELLDLALDADRYRPGQTVHGTLTVRRFRGRREPLRVAFALPEDLPEGDYELTVGDAASALYGRMREAPHRFDPRTGEELFQALQESVRPCTTCLYLRLRTPQEHLAVARKELRNLPGSRAGLLREAARDEATPFAESIEQTQDIPFLPAGEVAGTFTVSKRTDETPLRAGE